MWRERKGGREEGLVRGLLVFDFFLCRAFDSSISLCSWIFFFFFSLFFSSFGGGKESGVDSENILSTLTFLPFVVVGTIGASFRAIMDRGDFGKGSCGVGGFSFFFRSRATASFEDSSFFWKGSLCSTGLDVFLLFFSLPLSLSLFF